MINDINQSLKTILKNKLRSFIALFGIALCMALFTIMISIFNVSKDEFYKSLVKMGKNFIKINILNQDTRYYLGFDDITSLKNSNLYIDSVSPEICLKGFIASDFDKKEAYIIGGTEDYIDFMSMDIICGRFFSKVDRVNKENVILIDNVTSMALFGTENSIGREVQIGFKTPKKYRVIGVLKYPSNIWKKNKDIASFCIIPVDSYIENFKSQSLFEYLYISIKEDEDIYKISNSIIDFLKIRNNISKDVYKAEMFLRYEHELNYINTLFLTLIKFMSCACIMFTGINVFNSMFYIIESIRREMFLRKVNGENKLEVFTHLILVCIIFSFIGGLIGSLIGCLSLYIINLIFNVNLYIDILYMIYFILISILLGAIFGAVPCIYACNISTGETFNL